MIRSKVRIATVYKKDFLEDFAPVAMNTVRWMRISESLARLGFSVDMIINTHGGLREMSPNLRYVPFSKVNWEDYFMIKTLYQVGYLTLHEEDVIHHPFIITRLACVVGSNDAEPGVHFFGGVRGRLHDLQRQIDHASKYVTVSTEPNRLLWEKEFGQKESVLLIPTGVDRSIPPPARNPYAEFDERIAVYIGNLRNSSQQVEVNLLWQERLNVLGGLLKRKGIRLVLVGLGDTERLDRNVVTYLGPVGNERIWDYQYFADVGLVLAMGKVQNHESSKIYYYLRTGMPVVSENPVPNNDVIKEAHLGYIAEYGDNEMMAEMIEAAIFAGWDRKGAIEYILGNHTWDERARVYENVIRHACESKVAI